MAGIKLNRRSFLAGAGGVAVALPFLDCMWPSSARAGGTSPIQRYFVGFCGMSTGTQIYERARGTYSTDLATPTRVGVDYDLPHGLAPIGAHGVQADVAVISGLVLPWNRGSGIPAGGRPIKWHMGSLGPLVSGSRATDDASGRATPTAPTSDQIVADLLDDGDPSRFRSLQLGVQRAGYLTSETTGIISYRRDSAGALRAMAPNVSPASVYRALFSSFAPVDPAEAREADFRMRSGLRILDLVRGDAQRLLARVGTEDRRRLDQHFTEIAELEDRLRAMPAATGGACAADLETDGDRLAAFVDPPISTSTHVGGGGDEFTVGYAGEAQVADLMVDLAYLAFVCDRTRVISNRYTHAQSFLNAEPLVGVPFGVHELGHRGSSANALIDHSDMVAWHVDQFAALVRRLRDAPEGTGTVLDSTLLALTFEGGHGYDPESGDETVSHSSENMIVLLAGHAGGVRTGQHVRAAGVHPSSVLLTAMRALGHEGPLNEVTQTIDAIL